MESIEQNSSTTKRKYSPDESQISFNDLEEESSKKFFSSQSMTTNPYPSQQRASLGNYQQTTKIIQEFNIQQSSNHHSDITVSSTINIKSSSSKSSSHVGDLLSEADFQRVVQDITPADRDLFDEFLNGIKQRTDDYLFLSSFDDLPSQTHSQQRYASHHHSRGSNTIHYGPNAVPNSLPTSPAAQTLKQMAVQHQQRLNYNHHQHPIHPNHHIEQYQSNIYPNYPSTENHYYSTSSTSNGTDLIHSNDSNRFYFHQHPSSIGYSSGSSQMYPSSSYPHVSYYPSSTSINTHPNTLNISDDYLP